MLIYIHVPFCRQRCHYCAFQAQALGRDVEPVSSQAMRDYVDTLLMELAIWGDRLAGRRVETIFFGGGTPSLLPPKIVGIILDRLHKIFTIEDNAEISLEANPESLKGTLLPSQYLACGINRLSLGLQSLDGDMLRVLGRVHKAQDSLNSLLAAREAGFVNIGVDLMWGLPGQSVRHWLQSLKDVVRLAPEHISAYGLTLEEGTVLERQCRQGLFTLPPERDLNIMFVEGAAYLESQGYLQYEISNFSRMGYQCRHNLGYWQGLDYLGLGPSATSTIDNKRWTNPAHQKAWTEKIAKGQVAGHEEVLTPLIRVLEMIMLSLRTVRGLSLKRYKDMTGHDFLVDHRRMVQALHENALIRIRQGWLRLTPSGMVVSNAIISNLFEQTKKVLTEPLPPLTAEPVQSLRVEDAPDVRAVVWPKA
ncbi:MAG: radical SAM family heme chaperone HemW [Desulfovibrio sp.]|nr:radical SAM family heme chaperone HemW [Desulfovibrio sp.]